MKRVIVSGLAAIALTIPLGVALSALSGAGPTFDVVNGTATAAADHMSAGNDAFPNFATGAVDNRYPLASAHVDNLAAEGFGSPADTGPLGQTGAAAGGVTQPQYADAKYPPKAETTTVGQPPASYATAHAQPDEADTNAAASRSPGDTTSAQSRDTSITRLNRDLLRWRAQFLTADDQRRYPFVAGQAAEPDGADGLSAASKSAFDRNGGLLSVTADSRVKHAAFGGGAIVFRDIHMNVFITNNGTPQRKITIEIGSASVGGIPVTVGHDGVNVVGTAVPGTAALSDQANSGLNSALGDAGFHVYAVAPTITQAAHMTSVEATAVRVRWEGGDVQPGVPRSFVEHDLGEAFAFSLAVPSTQVASGGDGATVGGVDQTASSPSTRFIPGSPGTPGTPGSSANDAVTPSTEAASQPLQRTASKKPLWLLLLYFMWQSIVIGTAACLWWWRAEGPA